MSTVRSDTQLKWKTKTKTKQKPLLNQHLGVESLRKVLCEGEGVVVVVVYWLLWMFVWLLRDQHLWYPLRSSPEPPQQKFPRQRIKRQVRFKVCMINVICRLPLPTTPPVLRIVWEQVFFSPHTPTAPPKCGHRSITLDVARYGSGWQNNKRTNLFPFKTKLAALFLLLSLSPLALDNCRNQIRFRF